MKETKGNFLKRSKGITLVALVVTIVILIILATISINVVLGEHGLIKQAKDAVKGFKDAQAKEESDMNLLVQEYANIIAGGGEVEPPKPEEPEKPLISTTTNYVGYYANLDSDPEPEGVIYADLATGKKGDGQWGSNTDGSYNIPKKTGLKGYYVSKSGHSGKFGIKDVLTATGTGEDRFYVMALENVDENTHYWYNSANGNMNDYATATSGDFGTGKTNTAKIMSKWKESSYGSQNANDMWGLIQTQVSQGWFVPSKAEWSAFAEELGITSSNYGDFGLGDYHWSSSQNSEKFVWDPNFFDDYMDYNFVHSTFHVRLSTTF